MRLVEMWTRLRPQLWRQAPRRRRRWVCRRSRCCRCRLGCRPSRAVGSMTTLPFSCCSSTCARSCRQGSRSSPLRPLRPLHCSRRRSRFHRHHPSHRLRACCLPAQSRERERSPALGAPPEPGAPRCNRLRHARRFRPCRWRPRRPTAQREAFVRDARRAGARGRALSGGRARAEHLRRQPR